MRFFNFRLTISTQARRGLASFALRSRFTSISPDTRTWQSAWLESWDFASRRISTTRTWQQASRTFGGGGTSLSTWIKEYLYIPLGGSHVSVARSYLNLIICFLLSGLWHGASWNFVIWGCFHGGMLIADRAFWLRWQKNLPPFLNMVLCFALVMVGWVFFRCETFGHALTFLAALAGHGGANTSVIFLQNDINATYAVLLIGLVIVFAPAIDMSRLKERFFIWRSPVLAAHIVLFILCVGRMAVSTFHPFLYFRF
jgi:alginate O-acetyltransferase complex protein AlgI